MRNLLKLINGLLEIIGFILFIISFFIPYGKGISTYEPYYKTVGFIGFFLFLAVVIGLCLSTFFSRREARLLGYATIFASSCYYLGSSSQIYAIYNEVMTESISTLYVAGSFLLIYSILGILIEEIFKKDAN